MLSHLLSECRNPPIYESSPYFSKNVLKGMSSPKNECSVIMYSPPMLMERWVKFRGLQNISEASRQNSTGAFT